MIVQYNLKKLFAIIQYPVPNKAAGGMVLFYEGTSWKLTKQSQSVANFEVR